jgi:hypothetical protein
MISGLARRYDAPVFEPHVTIHIGADCVKAAKNAVAKVARESTLIRLRTLAIDHSNLFVKTLFVQFARSAQLAKTMEWVRDATDDSCQYELNPHLSLLYKNLTAANRRDLAASIDLPPAEVTFNTVKALRCVSPTRSRAEVEAWQVVAAASFSGDRV